MEQHLDRHQAGLARPAPIGFCGLRFVIASLALAIFNLCRGAIWPRTVREWGFIALTGFLTFGVNYGLLFWAEQFISSGLCAVLQATIPAFGLIFAHFMLSGERLTPLKGAGVSIGLLGVAVIFSGELHLAGKQALWGCAAVVVGAASTSFVNVLIKQRGQGFDPAVLANGQMIFGWIPLLALGWATEGMPWRYRWTGQAVFDLFYLALMGSSLAFCLLYWLVRRVEVTRIMLISLVTPVAAVLIGAATLGEKLVGRYPAGRSGRDAGNGVGRLPTVARCKPVAGCRGSGETRERVKPDVENARRILWKTVLATTCHQRWHSPAAHLQRFSK